MLVCELLNFYQDAPTDCFGQSLLCHKILVDNSIAHSTHWGRVVTTTDIIPIHFWIQLDSGEYVDYRLRCWLNHPLIPHGIFKAANYPVGYQGEPIKLPLVSEYGFQALLQGMRLGFDDDSFELMVLSTHLWSAFEGLCF